MTILVLEYLQIQYFGSILKETIRNTCQLIIAKIAAGKKKKKY